MEITRAFTLRNLISEIERAATRERAELLAVFPATREGRGYKRDRLRQIEREIDLATVAACALYGVREELETRAGNTDPLIRFCRSIRRAALISPARWDSIDSSAQALFCASSK